MREPRLGLDGRRLVFPGGKAVCLLGLIPAIPGYFLWRLKDRGGLSCDVRREGGGLVFTLPDGNGTSPEAVE